MIIAITPLVAGAETYRVATFAAPLSRDGPGLLLRDLMRGDDTQIAAAVAIIATAGPDILILTDFDYDLDGLALAAFADQFGHHYPHTFAALPNTGMSTGLDLDRNGRTGEPRDAQGYGRFAGNGGMAVLSRYPIGDVRDLSDLLWRDLPGAVLPVMDGQPFLTDAVQAVQRLSTTGHWIVPVMPLDDPLHILAFSATPPVFDGPEDRNGLRNRDELRLWALVLDGHFGPPPADFIVAGNANLDPMDGEGDRSAMAEFLARPDLQDPLPGQPTADWRDRGIGALRVSYVLPSQGWRVTDAGVASWGDGNLTGGAHHLVWVDVSR